MILFRSTHLQSSTAKASAYSGSYLRDSSALLKRDSDANRRLDVEKHVNSDWTDELIRSQPSRKWTALVFKQLQSPKFHCGSHKLYIINLTLLSELHHMVILIKLCGYVQVRIATTASCSMSSAKRTAA